jgi:chromosomal replication initiation ATPase DnaA
MRRQLASEADDPNVPTRRRLKMRVDPAKLLKTVADHFQVSSSEFTNVRKRKNDARAAVIYLHRKLTSESVGSLAERFGGVSLAAISKTVTRAEARRVKDLRWDRSLRQLENAAGS